MKIETPNNIEVLLHYHVSPTSHPRSYAPAVRNVTKKFLELGVIKKDGKSYQTTKLGEAWVKALCNTCIPKVAYVDEHENILSSK